VDAVTKGWVYGLAARCGWSSRDGKMPFREVLSTNAGTLTESASYRDMHVLSGVLIVFLRNKVASRCSALR
jgi:hypothetical protein